MTRTITALRDILKGHIYIYLKDRETCQKFYEQAEKEGFTFGGGIKPTQSPIDNIIAVNSDRTLAHVNFVGHMAFQSPSSMKDGLIRIDYARYIAGEENFYI